MWDKKALYGEVEKQQVNRIAEALACMELTFSCNNSSVFPHSHGQDEITAKERVSNSFG